MNVKIDSADCRRSLDTLGAGIRNAAVEAIRAAVKATEANAKATTLFRDQTGKTRQSIKGTSEALRGVVEARGAARFLEAGTVPHMIEGKRGGMLRFVVAGTTVYRRRVYHPGTDRRPFMTVARNHGEQTLAYGLEFFVDYAIARA